jgi:hypothetical protein
MGNYITVNDVKDKVLLDRITKAGWTDTEINKCIDESENYIEGRLILIGYSRQQLQNCPLVKTMCINYARYCILRDIYTQFSPSVSGGEEYEKWRDSVNEILESIENNVIKLTDVNGEIILPLTGDKRYKIEITTKDVKRAITMDNDWTWQIDTQTYANEDVVGQK